MAGTTTSDTSYGAFSVEGATTVVQKWLSGFLPPGDGPSVSPEPAVTRAEIAGHFVQSLLPQVHHLHTHLGRPGVFVLRCRFDGFYEDIRCAFEKALAVNADFEVLASWPTDRDGRKTASREVLDRLNTGKTHLYVVPHERVLKGVVPCVDGVLNIDRFTRETLARACQIFYDLPYLPEVPFEAWVAQVAPEDLLINSAVKGNPIGHVRSAVIRRLEHHTCENAESLESLLSLSSVRDWAEAVIEDIRDALDPNIRCNWSEIERAVVFYGDEGAGKTSLARAIARATGMHWYRVSARRWVSGSDDWGVENASPVAPATMEQDFDAARALAPAILFIEDLDSLPEDLAGPLGRLISEVSHTDPLFVIGSTKSEEFSDSVILRAANFERALYLPLPTTMLLSAALSQRLADVPHTLTQDEIAQAARLAIGGTVSSLDLYLRRARKTARRDGDRPLCFHDLAASILETPTPGARAKISETELRVTAYHEAGHAVMHFLDMGSGKQIQYATIVPRRMGSRTALGFVMRISDEDSYSLSKSEAFAMIRMFFGGRVAEEILCGADHITTGSGGSDSSDLAKATSLATYLIGRCGFNERGSLLYRSDTFDIDPGLRREVEALLKAQYEQTLKSLTANWHLVEALATRLVADQELTGQEVRQLLHEKSFSGMR